MIDVIDSCWSNFKRVIFDNIVFKPSLMCFGNKYVLMNLYSFRRMLLSPEDYYVLLKIDENINSGKILTPEESALYKLLSNSKQILTESLKKEYDVKRSDYIQRIFSGISPLINSITISPSYSCNFNCVYCYQKSFTNKQRHLSVQDVDSIINYLGFINNSQEVAQQIQAVTINGGEACLPQNVEVINYILDKFGKNKQCKFTLFSNGSNIVSLKDEIVFSKFEKVQISLDGLEDTFINVNRVKRNCFDTVIDAIKYLSSICEKIEVACMITPELIKNIDAFYACLDQLEVFRPNVSFHLGYISNFEKEEVDENFVSLKELAAFHKELSAKPYSKYFSMNSLFESRFITRFLFSKSPKEIPIRDYSCGIIEGRGLMFSPDGNVYWCICVNQDKGVIGDFHYPKPEHIEIIKEYCKRNIHIIEHCKTCNLKYVCTGGCPLHLIAKDKSIFDRNCGLFRNDYYMDHLEDFLW